MDIIILLKLRDGRPMSGYDVVTFIHKKFHMLVSPGSVYSLLYSMERDRLLKGMWGHGKRVYTLTDKGEEKVRAILKAKEKVLGLMVNLFV
jgi:DNA-binding PadR family transcriptional regulator